MVGVVGVVGVDGVDGVFGVVWVFGVVGVVGVDGVVEVVEMNELDAVDGVVWVDRGQKLKMSPDDGDEVKPDQPRLVISLHLQIRLSVTLILFYY